MTNIDLKRDFSHELNDIGNRLRNMENGRVYELSGAQMDGYLATNVAKLREAIEDLLLKIEGKKPSIKETLRPYFEKMN